MSSLSSFVDELKQKISVSNVVGKKVNLRRAGREFTGLCPFHSEKSPSFTVNDQKGFYHCFGCGAHGDIVRFVMQLHSYNFMEAVKFLADNNGVAMPKFTKESQEEHDIKDTIVKINEIACNYYEDLLLNKESLIAKKYARERGLKMSIVKKFRIGYAPKTSNALYQKLRNLGFTNEQILASGVVKEIEEKYYDKFSARLIFPIINQQEKIIAFGGRTLADENPKYLNSPETLIFKKGKILYNINNLYKYKTNDIFLVEGYMDVISMDRAGLAACAPMGTSFSSTQMDILWKFSSSPIFCFDGDEAGRKATMRAIIEIAPHISPEKLARICLLPNKLDPDDTLKKHSSNFFSENTISLSEFVWQSFSEKIDFKSAESRSILINNLNNFTKTIQNQTLQKEFQKFFADKLYQMRFSKKNQVLSTQINEINKNVKADRKSSNPVYTYERNLAYICLYHPDILKDFQNYEMFSNIDFLFDQFNLLRNKIFSFINVEENINITLEKNIKEHIIENLNSLEEYQDFVKLQLSTLKQEKIILLWKLNYFQLHLIKINQEFNNLDCIITSNSASKINNLLNEKNLVNSKLKEIERELQHI